MTENVYRSASCQVPLFVSILMNSEFSRQFFDKCAMKSQENPCSGGPVVPCGQTDGRIGMTKLIDLFSQLHLLLLTIYDKRENRRTVRHSFLMAISETTCTRAPSESTTFENKEHLGEVKNTPFGI
jgi:hypothetical protein